MLSEFIKDCLKPMHTFHWLLEISIEPVLFNNMMFWVAYNDRRLMI